MKKNQFKRLQGNTYYLELEHTNVGMYAYKKKAVLIDSGYTEEDANWIADLLESEGIKLEAILNTHAHPDNSGGSSYLKNRMGCRILCSQTQRPFLENPSRSNYISMVQAVVEKEKEEAEKKAKAEAEEAAEAQVEAGEEGAENTPETPVVKPPELAMDFKKTIIQPKPCKVDQTLDPRRPFSLSTGKTFEIIDLSGHVMGQYGVVTPDKVFFIADSLYTFDELAEKPIPYLESVDKFKTTLDYLLNTPYATFVPTHGNPMEFSISKEVLFHQRQMEMIEDAIILHLRIPHTREELIALLFATFGIEETIPNFYMMSSTIVSFLNALKRHNRVTIIHEDGKTRWFAKAKS